MKPEDKAVVQQALTWMDEIHPGNMTPMAEEAWNKSRAALRQLLEQPEPVFCEYCGGNDDADFGLPTDHCTDCARPQPEQPAAWVGLTDEEILAELPVTTSRPATSFARAVEAKLKEKNT